VGPPAKYQAKLQQLFPEIEITVSKKADSLYPIVSAASIVAKVTRDWHVRNWQFREQGLSTSRNFGSGYPSDPTTQKWLTSSVDPVFGFPSILRFSWKTSDVLLDKSAAAVLWSKSDMEEHPPSHEQLKQREKERAGRYRYFADNNLQSVTSFD
jgi:ribonuclease H2 subunit A